MPIRALLLLAAAALIVRLLYLLEHAGSPFFALPLLDELYYHRFAEAIAGGESLRPFGGFRPMLYPAFLAPMYWLGGSTFGPMLGIVVQHLLGIGTVVLTAVAGARLFRRSAAGIAAGVIILLAGPPLYFEGELLIEPFLAFLFMLVVWLIGRALDASGRGALLWWAGAGAVTALSMQARPNALFLFGVYPLLTLAALLGRRPNAWAPASALLAALPVLIVFGFLNSAQTGRFQILTNAGGINLYAGNSRNADGMIPRQARGVSYAGEYRDSIEVFSEQEYQRIVRAEGVDPSLDGAQVSRWWTRRAIGEVREAPLRWLGLMARKCWLLLWNYEIPNNKTYAFVLSHESLLLNLLPVRWWMLLALLPPGIWAVLRRNGDRPLLIAIIGVVALYALSIVLFFVNARFRIPLWAPLAVVAGGGAIALGDIVNQRERKALVAPMLAGGAFAVVSIFNWFGITKESFARDFFFRSIAHYQLQYYEESLSDAQESLRLDPELDDAMFQLGNAAFALQRWPEARAAWGTYAQRNPDEPRIWNNLGALAEAQDQRDAALELYNRALSLNPDHGNALLSAALLELEKGEVESARQKVARAASLVRPSAPLLIARGLLALRDGRQQEAFDLFTQASTMAPEFTETTLARHGVKPAGTESQ